MPEIEPPKLHILHKPQRHSVLPFLWRARCSCGWWAFAATEHFAKQAGTLHLHEEEPFPNLTLDEEPHE
jgi:hypothetical protein